MANEPRGQSRLIETWTFVNDADRLSSRYTYQDIGKLGYQQDTGQYWRLTSPIPTWQPIQGIGGFGLVFGDDYYVVVAEEDFSAVYGDG